MRPSKRTDILDAVLRIIGRDGVTAVTFESVADEAALTKSGIVYHFPSREALLKALQEHLAAKWDDALVSDAGPADTLDEAQRLAAYARVATESADRAELLLILEAATDPELSGSWNSIIRQWTPSIPDQVPLTEEQTRMIIAQLAADGLWLHDTITGTTMSPDVRAYLGQQIAQLVNRV